MPRKIRAVTTSFATLEDVQPPYNLRSPSVNENLALGLSLLDAAGAQQPDLVCLPETFTAAGMPYSAETWAEAAQPIPGPAFDALAERARRYGTYIVAGLPVLRDGRRENTAVLIDRQGHRVGQYAKMSPTEGEIHCGVTPGSQPAVFDTDFGRVGLAICFDLNWPSIWAEMAAQRADLVCWLSAYPGGFPLQSYAWTHRYPILSSVWSYESRVIDFTGRILASTTRWGRLAVCDLDLDRRLFHTDGQYDKILALQARYGARVRVETLGEEHLFTLECLDPALTPDAVIAEFGLTEYADYIEDCTRVQQQTRIGS
jgi:predicted amidohydrolase